jgi:hypothetical protein
VHAVDPQLILNAWHAEGEGPLRISFAQQLRAAERQAQELEAQKQHWFETRWDDMQRVIAAAAQMQLKLPKMNERAHARDRVAHYLETKVAPFMIRRSEHELAERLRECRQEYRRGITPTGKNILRWDRKAGLPLLCPDDAREEAMRLSRRIVPHLMTQLENGCSAHYGVLTMPNASPGELRHAMKQLNKKFLSLIRSCKRKDRPFPIVGAVAVMECPLGWRRDWHPHLNVIFVTDGFFDYGAFRERWHWNCELKKLSGERDSIERSFRELIKYSCRAVPEKSEDHAAKMRIAWNGEEIPPAPSMIEWTPQEFLEWWRAHRGFRRSRTYRSLYGLAKPAKVDVSQVRWVAVGAREYAADGAFVERSPLLEFIPGDKSTAEDIRKSLKAAWSKLLGPPDHESVLRDALRTIKTHFGPISLATE